MAKYMATYMAMFDPTYSPAHSPTHPPTHPPTPPHYIPPHTHTLPHRYPNSPLTPSTPPTPPHPTPGEPEPCAQPRAGRPHPEKRRAGSKSGKKVSHPPFVHFSRAVDISLALFPFVYPPTYFTALPSFLYMNLCTGTPIVPVYKYTHRVYFLFDFTTRSE